MRLLTHARRYRPHLCDPTGTGNGSSWANATNDLQAARDNTCGITEIWMAAGTYKPADYPTGCTTCTSPREYAFMLKDNIKIYGGFAGSETALSERVPGNETILSGDVDNNDTWDGGNAYHILISVKDNGVVLDGLTFQHAYTSTSFGFHTIDGLNVQDQDGPVYFKDVTAFTINNVKFVENFGNRYGSGLYVEETGGICSITKCQFTDNQSNSYAGGLYLEYSGENGGHTNIDSCQFTNNQSSNYAGAIYALSYSNDTISNCQFTGNTSDDGGALYLNYQGSGTATTIVGCTFDDNEADSEGGAVYLYQPEGNYVLDSCQFNGNYAGSKGGAITMYYSGYDYDNFTSINNCEFTENYAYEYGGAIYSEESYGNDVISNCTFTRDSSDYVGGAICLLYSGYNEINYTTIAGCEFTENYAYEYGGAIYTGESYGNDTISNCQFMDNKSDYYGGAVYFYYPSENGDNFPTVMDCMFTGNVSAEEGGAVLSYLGDGTQIIRSTFLENEAPIGGGVYLYDYSTYITDCLFAKNTATTDVGGGLYTYSDDLELINCTFADNVATAQPGAGIANEGTMNMVNTILWGNVQQGSGTTGQQQLFNDGGTVNISYSLIQDGMPDGVTDDGNNLHVDPLFNDPANDDYTLSGCSPAIDAGDNSVAAATDLTGNARIQGSMVDMGAYEKTPSVGAIDCITFIGFTTCNGVLTYTNADDYATGSVKVDFSAIPASGTLDLSSTALIGAASVDVSSLSGNSYTFTGVKILATGQEVEITASFSDNSGSASEMLTTPLPCSRYVFTGTGNWDVPENWQDNNQPANSGNNRHITYLGDAVIYPGMSFGSFGDSVVVAMGGSLDIQQSVTFSKSDGSVNGTGGFENNGTVTLTGNGTATFPNMDLYNNGDFTINGGANGLSMSGAANLFNTGTITNHKKIQAYSNITNYTTGVIDNQADINFSSGVFTNEGEFTHNWPGNSLYWNMGVNNSGTFNVVAGTITFSQNSNPYFTNTGTVTNGGTSIFEGSPIVTNETSGTFSNTGIMTLRKGMAQNGAFLNDVGGTLNLENGNVGLENNGTLTNEGTIEQKHAAFVRNNNLMYQNATMNCSAFSFFENNDSLLVPAGATINITSSGMAFTNAATGMFILDGTMTASNPTASVFVNKGILKGTGILDNSGGRTFDNDAMGSIQPGNISLGDKPNTPFGGEKSGASSDLSIGTLTIHRLNNVGSIDIEIGGNTADIEYDVLDLPANSTIGGTLNVTLVDGFEPACADVFDIITHTSVTGTFATLNLPDGFSVGYPANKVTVSFGEMGLSIDNLSDADCANTTCTTDDTFTADVTVTYGAVPASGTLELTGPTIVGSVAAVNVGDLAADSHTFTGVTLMADGGDIDLTAAFSDGCDYNDGSLGTAPECGGSPFMPTNITVSGFGCIGPEGTYSPNGTVNGAPAWLSGFGFTIEWSGSQWEIKGMSFVWSANSTGSIANLPCSTGWTDPTGCALSPGSIALSGGCGALSGGSGPACAVTNISLNNTGSCNDNGTTDDADDYFTTDVTVTFEYAPVSGTLTLKQGNTVLTTTTDDLTCTTSHTFTGVQLPSDGNDVILTAEFSGDCTYTSGSLMTAPGACSCVPASFTACPGPQVKNTSGNTCAATVNYSVTAGGDPAPELTYAFTGATTGTGSGTGSGSTLNRGVTNVVVVATNGCGSESCMFTVTVEDNTPPTATCKNHTAVLAAQRVGDHCACRCLPVGQRQLYYRKPVERCAQHVYLQQHFSRPTRSP
ncbi:MAG: choice-of-anchor Q domain-containing protein [Saprospiraceae bacterium]